MKEKLLVSACLLGEKVRYDGTGFEIEEINRLRERYELIPMCPEVLGGLPVPRDPAEIRNGLVRTINGKDVTANYETGAGIVLDWCRRNGVEKALLKARSPSCGKDKIYDGTYTGTLTKGHGVACRLLLENGIKVYTENEIGGLWK